MELLSSPLIIPKKLKWNDTAGHDTAILTKDIRNYDHTIATVSLFVVDYTAYVNRASWSGVGYWTREMVDNSVYCGVNDAYKYMGLLPVFIGADPNAQLEDNPYLISVAFAMATPTTIRVNQSIIQGWTANNFVAKLISVKGYNN